MPLGKEVVVIASGAVLLIGVVENVATAVLQLALPLNVKFEANVLSLEAL